jgi:hypothetical protein
MVMSVGCSASAIEMSAGLSYGFSQYQDSVNITRGPNSGQFNALSSGTALAIDIMFSTFITQFSIGVSFTVSTGSKANFPNNDRSDTITHGSAAVEGRYDFVLNQNQRIFVGAEYGWYSQSFATTRNGLPLTISSGRAPDNDAANGAGLTMGWQHLGGPFIQLMYQQYSLKQFDIVTFMSGKLDKTDSTAGTINGSGVLLLFGYRFF